MELHALYTVDHDIMTCQPPGHNTPVLLGQSASASSVCTAGHACSTAGASNGLQHAAILANQLHTECQ